METPAPLTLQATAATVENSYTDVNGDRIAYRSIGTGSPILLANRMRGTIDTWDPLFLDNLAQSHRVITFDYPGVGYSAGKLPGHMSEVAKFIIDFAATLSLKTFVLAGWSWGGAVSQFALTEYPQHITHAILIGTNPPGKNEHPMQQYWLDRALKPINDLDDEYILFFEPRSTASVQAAEASRNRIYARPDVVSHIPATADEIQAYFKGVTSYHEDKADHRAKLSTSSVPILILCGDHDPSVPVENWYALSGKLPTAQLIVFPASGHGPQHQYPGLSVRYICEFIKHTSQ